MKKKLIVLGLITAMTISMVACGNDDKSNNETTNGKETTDTTVAKDEDESGNGDTTDKKEDTVDELSDEYLLSLEETTVEDFNYHEMDDGNIAIDRYWGTGGGDVVIVVPQEINGKKVTKISTEAFNRVYAKAVVLGENITELSTKSFTSVSLDKLVIAGPVVKLEEDTFGSSTVLAISLPKTLEEIGIGAFNMCNIDEIKFPSSLKKIGDSAFINSGLKKVYFEGGQVEVGMMAFSNCRELTEVHISDGDVQFGQYVFERTDNVTIFTSSGSAAEEYAKANGINYENE